MSALLRCVLVEDEAESRANMVGFLGGSPGIELVGVAASGPEAVHLVDTERPDLLLLDIHLPEMDGIEVLRRVRHRPEVVFTTAHEAYAVTAFELGALDYLVKPFGRERLEAAIGRVRARAAGDKTETPAVDRALAASHRPIRRLFVRRGERIIPVNVDDIVRIDACDEYAEIHAGKETYLVQIPLRELVQCLDPETFEQVHRSHIVNLGAVEHFRAADDRRLLVTLRDGSSVLASRAASERIRQRIR